MGQRYKPPSITSICDSLNKQMHYVILIISSFINFLCTPQKGAFVGSTQATFGNQFRRDVRTISEFVRFSTSFGDFFAQKKNNGELGYDECLYFQSAYYDYTRCPKKINPELPYTGCPRVEQTYIFDPIESLNRVLVPFSTSNEKFAEMKFRKKSSYLSHHIISITALILLQRKKKQLVYYIYINQTWSPIMTRAQDGNTEKSENIKALQSAALSRSQNFFKPNSILGA